MKEYDLMIIGPATRDVNIDYTGEESRIVGGAVTFCTASAMAAGAKVFALVKADPAEKDVMEVFRMPEEDKALAPSPCTTLMRNQYHTPDRDRREVHCDAQSSGFQIGEVPPVRRKLTHLAGLCYGDYPDEFIEALHSQGPLAADIQGFLRHIVDTNAVFRDWDQKLRFLPYFRYLKTDTAEAEILTGLTDRREAARQLYDWGARETLISNAEEMLVYDGEKIYTCPVRARNLSGRTGRGDTVFAAYIARRTLGDDIPTALLYATACVSLKMETPGVFRGSYEDVEAYIHDFYS